VRCFSTSTQKSRKVNLLEIESVWTPPKRLEETREEENAGVRAVGADAVDRLDIAF
jgi:hypothetical protein